MGKPFVCDTWAFIYLETDTYKKIEISILLHGILGREIGRLFGEWTPAVKVADVTVAAGDERLRSTMPAFSVAAIFACLSDIVGSK